MYFWIKLANIKVSASMLMYKPSSSDSLGPLCNKVLADCSHILYNVGSVGE